MHGWINIDGILRGTPKMVYSIISADNERRIKGGHNNMKMMREALGFPPGPEGVEEWLDYWASLEFEQRNQLRRMKLDDRTKVIEFLALEPDKVA